MKELVEIRKEILKNRKIEHIGFRCVDKRGRMFDAGRLELNRKEGLKEIREMINLFYEEAELCRITETYVVIKYVG